MWKMKTVNAVSYLDPPVLSSGLPPLAVSHPQCDLCSIPRHLLFGIQGFHLMPLHSGAQEGRTSIKGTFYFFTEAHRRQLITLGGTQAANVPGK